jgi:hypothetical protein
MKNKDIVIAKLSQFPDSKQWHFPFRASFACRPLVPTFGGGKTGGIILAYPVDAYTH